MYLQEKQQEQQKRNILEVEARLLEGKDVRGRESRSCMCSIPSWTRRQAVLTSLMSSFLSFFPLVHTQIAHPFSRS
jgi:hypothetical protein